MDQLYTLLLGNKMTKIVEDKKLTNADLVTIREGLERVQDRLPLPLSHKLATIRVAVDDALRPFEKERKRITEQFAKRDKNKNIVIDDAGNIEWEDVSGAQAELDKLSECEVDVRLDKISLKDFPKKKEISSKGLSQLNKILTA